MATNSLHTNGAFSTFPLLGKLFYDAKILPLSNTGEKLALAQQALSNIRKLQLDDLIITHEEGQPLEQYYQGIDLGQKQQLIAQFDEETHKILEALKTGYRDYPLLEVEMVLTSDGKSKPVLIRRPANKEIAKTDWLNFTIHKSTFDALKHEKLRMYKNLGIDDKLFTNSDYAYAMSEVLRDIFGFGIKEKMLNGLNYYQEAYKLENGCGNICIGGQNDTIMITITGIGCTVGKYGWEEDLHAWLRLFANRPKITRIDFAFDDMQSDYASIHWAKEQFDLGGYKTGGRPPAFNIIGDYWQPDGSGSTAYVGKRTSSKFARIYEKGKQLGCKTSPWIRVEVEYKAVDFYIPLDAILRPTQHFLAAYPCFHAFDYATAPLKFETIKKAAEIAVDKAHSICHRQMGRFLAFLRDYYQDDSLVLDLMTHEVGEYPKRLEPYLLDYSNSMPPSAMPA